jgi:hypothetical protein
MHRAFMSGALPTKRIFSGEDLPVKVINFSLYIVIYDFIIGVLLMIASEKLGFYAGHLSRSHRVQIARLTRVGTFTFGAVVGVLTMGTYLAFYVLKL